MKPAESNKSAENLATKRLNSEVGDKISGILCKFSAVTGCGATNLPFDFLGVYTSPTKKIILDTAVIQY